MKGVRCWLCYGTPQYNEYLLEVLSLIHLVQVVPASVTIVS